MRCLRVKKIIKSFKLQNKNDNATNKNLIGRVRKNNGAARVCRPLQKCNNLEITIVTVLMTT